MAQRRYYYTLNEAQQLKQRLSLWINRSAHLGNGEYSIVTEITILPRKTLFKQDPEHQTFYLEFRFVNSKKIDASHFLLCNEPETINAQIVLQYQPQGVSKGK